MSATRKVAVLTPIEVLRNCRGKAVSIELTDGETVNGIVMRSDRTMNVVLKQCIRTSATGDAFWRAREFLVRGASVRNVRMDESVLRVAASSAAAKAATSSTSKKRRRQQQQATTLSSAQPRSGAASARLGKRSRANA